MKKRKVDALGSVKQPQYRTIPVPEIMINYLDLVFGIRTIKKMQKGLNEPMLTMSRSTAYRLVKRVMDRTGIKYARETIVCQ